VSPNLPYDALCSSLHMLYGGADKSKTFMVSENENIFNGKWWKRAKVTLAIGKPFHLKEYDDRHLMLHEGTKQIMESLAELLPESYRGKYLMKRSDSQLG
jgi:hypothetical protein